MSGGTLAVCNMLRWATCAVSYCDRRALKRNQPEAFPSFMRGRAHFPPANLSLELREPFLS
uniref:Uncharacterized protein n=1 Tax=Anguilla anguilla TaxID=7936 RepID=A0A0E9PT55_ANGAN